MIGILVLLGICIGMLREQGKWLTGVSFMAIAAVLFYVFEMNFSAITYEREIAASGVFFMAFPEKLLWHFALCPSSRSMAWKMIACKNDAA